MKLNLSLKTAILVVSLSGIVSLVNAQSRYKHLPRVKVEKTYEQKSEKKEKKNHVAIIPLTQQNPSVSNEEVVAVEESFVASTEVTIVEEKSTPKESKVVVKNQKVTSHKKTINVDSFTQKIKKSVKLLKVKDVEKTTANIPLILMIGFYVLGLILIIIAILMLYGVIAGATFGAFIALIIAGSVFLLAASVILTLMKLGVF